MITNVDIRQLDITDIAAIPGVIEKIVADYGRIDVLVNNAGFAMAGFLEDVTLEELRRAIRDQLFRPRRNHQSRAARHAAAAIRPHPHDHFDRRTLCRPGDWFVRRLKICAGRLERIACASRCSLSACRSCWSNPAPTRPISGSATLRSARSPLTQHRQTTRERDAFLRLRAQTSTTEARRPRSRAIDPAHRRKPEAKAAVCRWPGCKDATSV